MILNFIIWNLLFTKNIIKFLEILLEFIIELKQHNIYVHIYREKLFKI